jgi:hypothetical protein
LGAKDSRFDAQTVFPAMNIDMIHFNKISENETIGAVSGGLPRLRQANSSREVSARLLLPPHSLPIPAGQVPQGLGGPPPGPPFKGPPRQPDPADRLPEQP